MGGGREQGRSSTAAKGSCCDWQGIHAITITPSGSALNISRTAAWAAKRECAMVLYEVEALVELGLVQGPACSEASFPSVVVVILRSSPCFVGPRLFPAEVP